MFFSLLFWEIKHKEDVLGDRRQTCNQLWLETSGKECKRKGVKKPAGKIMHSKRKLQHIRVQPAARQNPALAQYVKMNVSHRHARGECLCRGGEGYGIWCGGEGSGELQEALGPEGSCGEQPGMRLRALNPFCSLLAGPAGLGSLGALEFWIEHDLPEAEYS